MSMLDFGMKNREDRSLIKRSIARMILWFARKYADGYERYLKRQDLDLLENPLRDRQMMQRIREQAEQMQQEQSAEKTKTSPAVQKKNF